MLSKYKKLVNFYLIAAGVVAAQTGDISPWALYSPAAATIRFTGTQPFNTIQAYDGTNAYGITLYNGTSPSVFFQANGTSQIAYGLSVSNPASWATISLVGAQGGAHTFGFDNAIRGISNVGFEIYDFTTGNGRLVIDGSGNVGIGTLSPQYLLSVNGSIQAKEIIVQTGWSDYVFDANYHLMPLSEVEKQIHAEKHLPGVPSASEIAAHGVNVGAIEAKLLEQIEELTLRQIQQEKMISAQQGEIAELHDQLRALQN